MFYSNFFFLVSNAVELVKEITERFHLGLNVQLGAITWCKLICKKKPKDGIYTYLFTACLATGLSSRDNEYWFPIDRVLNYLSISEACFFKYVKFITKTIPEANINFRRFHAFIGYLRECDVVTDKHTIKCKKVFEHLMLQTDLSPKYIVGVALLVTRREIKNSSFSEHSELYSKKVCKSLQIDIRRLLNIVKKYKQNVITILT